MSSRINTVLIIGATAGIGEAFARRFHQLGKKIIATGRNQDKLNTLAKELPGLEAIQVCSI
jgi:short-subunit dehydrogenase involved in D-alanine esterification of teichoic acids